MTTARTTITTATLAATLLVSTSLLGRALLPDRLLPVAPERAGAVIDPAPWQPPPAGAPVPTTRTATTVSTPTGEREANVVAPADAAPGAELPGVVLLAGSGTSSADRMLGWAEAVAAQGVVCLTIAKPEGYGIVTRDYDQLADDAAAAASALMQHASVDPQRVFLAGLSEGGWIAPLAATREPRVSGVVMLSGPTVSPGEQMLWIADDGLVDAGVPTGARLTVAHALGMPIPGMSYTRHASTGTLAAVEQPILAVYGVEDGTVPVADGASLVLASGDRRAVRLAEGLGHGLSGPSGPDAGVVSTLTGWVADPQTDVGQADVRGTAPPDRAPAVRLPDVPGWQVWLLVTSSAAALLGWVVNRVLPRSDRAGERQADRLAVAGAGSVVANHVGLGALVGLGMAHAGGVVLALPWAGMKLLAIVLSWQAASAVVRAGGRPGSARALAGWVAGAAGLAGVGVAGATRSVWGGA